MDTGTPVKREVIVPEPREPATPQYKPVREEPAPAPKREKELV